MPDCPANSARRLISGEPAADAGRRLRVLLPLPLAGTLDYRAPEGEAVPEPGRFVRVTLGPRRIVGVVWDGEGDDVPDERLKPVAEILPTPKLPAELRRFVERVAAYTLAPPGAVLRMTMSIEAALTPAGAAPSLRDHPRGAGAFHRIAAAAGADPGAPAGARNPARWRRRLDRRDRAAGRGRRGGGAGADRRGVCRRAFGLGIAAAHRAAGLAWPGPSAVAGPGTGGRRRLVERVETGGFSVTVLDGVTGSGKTETYFAAIAAALAADRQVLVLLPEIALSRAVARALPPPLRREPGGVAFRYRPDPAPRHLARGRRWPRAGGGRRPLGLVPAVARARPHRRRRGARPLLQAGGRRLSIRRATWRCCAPRWRSIPIVLVSATPSLETVVNVSRGRYGRVHLPRAPRERQHCRRSRIVDMRARTPAQPARFLSPPLVEAIEQTLAAGEQALLFLNRRGYAPLTLCRACGHRLQCPSCTAWLVEHRFTGRLQCHHCGYSTHGAAVLPGMRGGRKLGCLRAGRRAAREEVAARFPEARIALMVSDTLAGPRAAAELAERMVAHRYRSADRDADRRQGPSFPDADPGRRGRCRSRPCRRRSARRRAHLSAAASGRRAAPAGPSGRAGCCSRPTCPSSR